MSALADKRVLAESKEINTLMGYKSIQCKFTKNERVWLLNDFNLLRRPPEHPKNRMREKALIGDGEFNFRM